LLVVGDGFVIDFGARLNGVAQVDRGEHYDQPAHDRGDAAGPLKPTHPR
jgi:hypothetical protein